MLQRIARYAYRPETTITPILFPSPRLPPRLLLQSSPLTLLLPKARSPAHRATRTVKMATPSSSTIRPPSKQLGTLPLARRRPRIKLNRDYYILEPSLQSQQNVDSTLDEHNLRFSQMVLQQPPAQGHLRPSSAKARGKIILLKVLLVSRSNCKHT